MKKGLILLVLIVVFFCCSNVFAEEAPSIYINTPPIARIGDTIKVSVGVGEINAAGGEFRLEYDNTLLKAVSGKLNTDTSTKLGYSNIKYNYNDNTCFFAFANSNDVDITGILADFEFEVLQEGTAEFTFSRLSFSDLDLNDIELNFKTASTAIKSSSFLMGDVNGDSVVDDKDAALILKYSSRIDVEINTFTADVDNNDVIDLRDSIKLMEMIDSN